MSDSVWKGTCLGPVEVEQHRHHRLADLSVWGPSAGKRGVPALVGGLVVHAELQHRAERSNTYLSKTELQRLMYFGIKPLRLTSSNILFMITSHYLN